MRIWVLQSRTWLRALAFALVTLSLAACAPGVLEERQDAPPTATDTIHSADLSAKSPNPTRPAEAPAPGFRGFSIFGSPEPSQGAAPQSASTDVAAAVDPPAGVNSDAGGYTLNFENTPVAAVVKAVLSDTLGLSYVIDPRAQGAISLSTGRPVQKKDLLFVLETALGANNLAMVRMSDGGYRIGPANDGSVGPIDPGGGADPGYGMTVIPLQYASGTTISRLLEGFAARPGAIRANPSGTMLIVVGNGQERRAAIDTVRSFDVDWMRGQSVGLYPVHNSEPESVATALDKIMDSGEGGLSHGLVKLQPLARQNAILVVSAKPQLLRAAESWIKRLDSSGSAGQSVHVYKVRYGDAKQIAQLLAAMFVSANGSATTDNASNQLAPNAGENTLSASERLTGGRQNSNTPGAPATPAAGEGQSGQGANSPFGGLQSSSPTSAFAGGAGGGGGGAGALLPGVRILADVSNNSVVVYANAENYQTIERALQQLDRVKVQVAVDVTIAEVTLNDNLNYGVQFYLSTKQGAILNTTTGQSLSTSTANSATSDSPAGFNILVGSQATPAAIINALNAVTDVRILSNPSLVVLDNQEASLEVGDQVPVTTGSATVLSTSNTVVNTVDYKNTGIILHVLPRVSPDNTVTLAINQEISSVPPGTSSNLTPTISQRKVKSSVSIVSGQMVLLAGLIADEQSASRSGVPGLSQLPWLGSAFGTTGKSTSRTELIILIRPQVIRDGMDASSVAEQLRAKMRSGRNPAFSLPDALNINTRAY